MAIQGFVESFYLNSKLNQMQEAGKTGFTNILQVRDAIQNAGMTVEEHFQKYSLSEGTSPNQYFNTQEYMEAKADQMNANEARGRTDWDANAVNLALADAGYTNAYDHFTDFGFEEDVNPSNAFDVSAYLEAKAAEMNDKEAQGRTDWDADAVLEALADAGLNPVAHYLDFGQTEGLTVTAVPAGEQVTPAGDDPDVEGKTITLTAADNAYEGTIGDDTFRAVTTNTLDTPTMIDGLSGDDVLNIADTAIDAANAPLIENVERFNNADVTSGNLDLTDVSGVEQLWVTGAGAGYDSATLAPTFGIKGLTAGGVADVNFAGSVDLSGSSDSVDLAVNSNTNAAGAQQTVAFDFNGDETDFETVNLTTLDDGAGAGDVDFSATTVAGAGYTGLETLNVSGEGDVELTFGAANTELETIDASDNEGNVTTEIGGALSALLTSDEVSIETGDGADEITFVVDSTEANAVTITGGANGDEFILENAAGTEGNLNAAANNDDLLDSLLTITDFDGSEDTLDISDFGITEIAQNPVQTAVNTADPDNLFEAATAAFGETSAASGNEEAVFFNYDGNLYIGVDVDDAGDLSAVDALIELSGVQYDDLSSSNLVTA